MPKRPVTPEIDDGAKYLTVVNPYPVRPNMYLDKPRELFAQWIAACIGPTYIRAFYYKPTSPGSIIVEVDESLPDFKVLLGLHKWSEFLRDPKGHDNTVSRVYYCTYGSDRIVQKNGWKRVDVQDAWLKKQSKLFVVPYPSTSWCDVPKHSDVIQNELCRPLPRQNFPPPPPPQPAPVVGTPEWQEWKMKQDNGKKANAWTRNVPVPVTIASSSVPRPAWSTGTTTPLSSSLPPMLTRGGSSTGDSEASTSSGSSVGGSQPLSPVGDDDNGPQVGIVSENIEGALEALGLKQDNSDDDEFHTIVGSDSIVGPLLQVQYTILEPEEPVQSLWDDYVPSDDDNGDDDDDDDEGIKKAAAKNPELCKVHNKVCKKGICKAYAAQLREKRNRERQEQRRKDREDAFAKREKKLAKKAASVSTASTGTSSGAASPALRVPPPRLHPGAARQLPAHLQRGAPPTITRKSPPPVSPLTTDVGDVDGDGDGRATPTPSRQVDDDVRSVSSGGWGSISDSPWGPVHRPKGNDWDAPSSKPPPRNPAAASTASKPRPVAPKPTKAWGGWSAQSISASSMQRNCDSWSVGARTRDDDDWPSAAAAGPATTSSNLGRPARDSPRPPPQSQAQEQQAWGAWGKAPSVSASSVRRNNDAWSTSGRSVSNSGKGDDARSVAASKAAGWGAEQPWGSTDAVKAARVATKKTWADQVDEELEGGFDARSVAGSTGSGRTWGNVSAGPW